MPKSRVPLIAVMILALVSCAAPASQNETEVPRVKFTINVNRLYAKGLSGNFYRIDQDSIKVFYPFYDDSWGKDNNDFLDFKERISIKHSEEIARYLETKISSLDTAYINPSLNVGLNVKIDIGYKAKMRTIRVKSMYNEDVNRLLQIVDQMVPKKHQLNYEKYDSLLKAQSNISAPVTIVARQK